MYLDLPQIPKSSILKLANQSSWRKQPAIFWGCFKKQTSKLRSSSPFPVDLRNVVLWLATARTAHETWLRFDGDSRHPWWDDMEVFLKEVLLMVQKSGDHHLGCIKPCKYIMGGTIYQLVQDFWTINSMNHIGFSGSLPVVALDEVGVIYVCIGKDRHLGRKGRMTSKDWEGQRESKTCPSK